MSRRDEASVDYIDTMSSGDSNNAKNSQQTLKPKEVNNNEVDELSKELEMGCIVDAMKRPSNICVEDCVHESDTENTQTQDADDDAYSDEFEDEEDCEEKPKDNPTVPSSLKLSKSQSSVSSIKAQSVSARSGTTDLGLVETLVRRDMSVECGVPGCLYHKGPWTSKSESVGQRTDSYYASSICQQSKRRMNMSFTNERMREIERHNNILLSKIVNARNTRKSSILAKEQPPVRRPPPAAAVLRKNHQRQIDHDNLILLKKIQRAKSSAYNNVRRR